LFPPVFDTFTVIPVGVIFPVFIVHPPPSLQKGWSEFSLYEHEIGGVRGKEKIT